jgi:hypothetical protein
MAEVTVRVKKVKKVVEVEEKQVVITLPMKEAEVLRTLLGLVGGDPEGPRGLLDNIYGALCDAKIQPSYTYKMKLTAKNPAYRYDLISDDVPARIETPDVYIESKE